MTSCKGPPLQRQQQQQLSSGRQVSFVRPNPHKLLSKPTSYLLSPTPPPHPRAAPRPSDVSAAEGLTSVYLTAIHRGDTFYKLCLSATEDSLCSVSPPLALPPILTPLLLFFHFFSTPTNLSLLQHCPAPSSLLSPLSKHPPVLEELRPSCLELHHCSPFYEFFPTSPASYVTLAVGSLSPPGFRQSTGRKTALAGPSTFTINHTGFTPCGYSDPLQLRPPPHHKTHG